MKRILSIILALALLIGVMPFAVFANGESYVDSSFNIEYDTSMAIATTRLTGREVSAMLRAAITSPKGAYCYDEGSWYVYLVDYSPHTSIGYFENGDFKSLYASDDKLQAGVDYYYWFNIENQYPYVWDLDNLPTVTVNGAAVDKTEWRAGTPDGDLDVYIKAPLNETGSAVAKVTVTPEITVVQRGTTKQFTAKALGTSDEVVWSVSGNNKPETVISADGLLTVASNDASLEIAVIATSKINPKINARVRVKLINEEVRIDSVTVDPPSASVTRGTSVMLTVTVTGTDILDAAWKLEGSEDDGTTMSVSYDNTCTVYVSSNETSEKLTVTVSAVYDPGKFAVAEITVLPALKIPSSFNIEYKASDINFTTDMTGRQATAAFRNSITSQNGTGFSGEPGWYVYFDAYAAYTAVGYFDGDGIFRHLEESDERLNTGTEYYLWFNVEDADGYEWDIENMPDITVNGAAPDIAKWNYKSYTGDINVYVKVNVAVGTGVVKGDFNKDGKISVDDALSALRIAAKLAAETPEAIAIGDIDGDGKVGVNDALAILRVAAKLADASTLE